MDALTGDRAASDAGSAGGHTLLRLSLAWAIFATVAGLAPVGLALDPRIQWWGMAHQNPLVLLALAAAMLGGLVVVPVLLGCGAVAVARGNLPRRRFLRAILPLNLAALGIPWLAYWIADSLARS